MQTKQISHFIPGPVPGLREPDIVKNRYICHILVLYRDRLWAQSRQYTTAMGERWRTVEEVFCAAAEKCNQVSSRLPIITHTPQRRRRSSHLPHHQHHCSQPPINGTSHWKYSLSTEGIDILFDEINRKKNGGPAAKVSKQVSADITSFDETLVTELNSSTSKGGGPADIKQLMEKTISHRNHLRSVGDNSILKTYTKFAECDFMEIGALLILLHLIPPTAQGKGKGGRCKIDGAKGRIITFHKSIIDTWNKETTQPNLLCLGESTANLSTFFVICDGVLIPVGAQNTTESESLRTEPCQE
ncbi:hypothetical protein Fcan01_16137 [Folsomia candida]|uniref:Uncharacterized protein n=1 Tax=Folsomia candida TaxID=158441 RepID=A0A226DTH1_FOLCA|nr:hypothetical protein Fcan01_16137 [Folsomia candida]